MLTDDANIVPRRKAWSLRRNCFVTVKVAGKILVGDFISARGRFIEK